MSLYLPKAVKENVSRIIREALQGYTIINGYRVHRVSTDGTNVNVMLKSDRTEVTYMLTIKVSEVR